MIKIFIDNGRQIKKETGKKSNLKSKLVQFLKIER